MSANDIFKPAVSIASITDPHSAARRLHAALGSIDAALYELRELQVFAGEIGRRRDDLAIAIRDLPRLIADGTHLACNGCAFKREIVVPQLPGIDPVTRNYCSQTVPSDCPIVQQVGFLSEPLALHDVPTFLHREAE